MKRKEISNKINNQKNENIDLIIITVIVGLGVNILATALINSLPIKYNIYYLLIIGIALSLFVLFIYIIIKIKSLKTKVEIRSNFIFNNDIKDFIIIPDYIVTNDMQKYIYSLLKESKKFNKKYLNSEYIKTGNKESLNKEDDDFKNIINELIEYLILDKLAMTSIDFYNIFDKISIYNIDNLPSSIKENEFLKTFTKEIKKRKEFHREDVMVAKIEKNHHERYETLLKNVRDGKVFKKDNVVVWQCANCGHIHVAIEAPAVCPVCSHPQSYFQLEAKNY